MLLVPIETSFLIETGLNKKQIVEILREKTAEPKLFNPFPTSEFLGKVEESGFELEVAMDFFRSLNPRFFGSFQPIGEGTTIRVRTTSDTARANCIGYMVGVAGTLALACNRVFARDYSFAALLFGLSTLCALTVVGVIWLNKRKLADGAQRLNLLIGSAEKRHRRKGTT